MQPARVDDRRRSARRHPRRRLRSLELGATDQEYDAIHTLPDPGAVDLVPGVGYWLWYENSFSVTMQGLVRDRTEPYRMSLIGEEPGLGRPNFLGHPYDFDVAWPEVVVYYGGSEYDLAGAESAGILRNIMWKPYTATGYTEWDGTASRRGHLLKLRRLLGQGVAGLRARDSGHAVDGGGIRRPHPRGVRHRVGRSVLSAELGGVTATATIGQLPDAVRRLGSARCGAHAVGRGAPVLRGHARTPTGGSSAATTSATTRSARRTDSWRFEVQSNLGGSVVLRWDGPRSVLKQSVVVDLETG